MNTYGVILQHVTEHAGNMIWRTRTTLEYILEHLLEHVNELQHVL